MKPYSDNIIFIDTEFSSVNPYKGEILSIYKEHHALDDAKLLREIYLKFIKLTKAELAQL